MRRGIYLLLVCEDEVRVSSVFYNMYPSVDSTK
jgi:hypothetical protein